MELTREQYNIIQSNGDIKINAVAGSGKTTTIIEYARTRPRGSRILYLAFNKSVRTEAIKRFAEKGLGHVHVETAHSLAYKHIVTGSNYKLRAQSYRTYEIAEMLRIRVRGEQHEEYVVANHINKYLTLFCNSNKGKVLDLNYLDTVTDKKAKDFVKRFHRLIESQTRLFLSKMDKGEIEIIHDFYLKKFQLSNPVLPYDYILFDEGQDASPAMLDVFLKQKAVKVIVGDTHQQIYGWRHAVNSLENTTFKSYQLSTSFRFSQDIANLAVEILQWKGILGDTGSVTINGKGNNKASRSNATLARTNLGLLLKAIGYVSEKRNAGKIYFEGNFNSYTYADEGASLYDVLNLYNWNHRLIKDPLIRKMKSIWELETYIEKTEDAQLAMMVEIVKEYGNQIPHLIRTIKEKHIDNDDKDQAEMIFSTIHRCKGMEYDTVHLANDFISNKKLEKIKNDPKKEEINQAKLNEEINLLYVAVTRTRNKLSIPSSIMPEDFPVSPHIQVLEEKPDMHGMDKFSRGDLYPGMNKYERDFYARLEKVRSQVELRKHHREAFKPWTPELDEELTIMYCEGHSVSGMAKHFGRTKGAILSRINKLELEDLYGKQ
jgi:superfamily I DNA/RNA helicase